MSDLRTRAQIILLARALSAEPEDVRFLESLGADDVRELRERISGKLFDEQSEKLHRLASTVKIAPAGLSARIAEKAIPPVVAGRAAGLVPLDKMVLMVSKLSPEYMSVVSAEIDPRAIAEAIPLLPIPPAVAATRVTMARGDHVTLARFIDFASEDLIRAVEKDTDDDESLLQVGFYVQSDAHLSQVVRMLPPERVRAMITTAATGPAGLLIDGVFMTARVDDDLKQMMGDILIAQDDDTLTRVVDTVVDADAVAEFRTVLAQVSPASLERLAANPAVDKHPELSAFVRERLAATRAG